MASNDSPRDNRVETATPADFWGFERVVAIGYDSVETMAPVDGSSKSSEGRSPMSTSATSFFHASSLLAVILSATAIYFTQQTPARTDPVPTTTESNSTAQLEEAISSLRGELITLQFRLDALELTSIDAPATAEDKAVEIATRGDLDGRIIDAVDRVMEEKGLEYARAAQERADQQQQRDKLNSSRDGFVSWVDNGRAKLPNLYHRLDELDLAPQTAIEVEEILENGFQTMAFLTEQLYTDPPPEQADAMAIMGEVKEEAGSIIQDLDEILTPEEMIALGQVYSEEVDPRLGQGFINNGNEGDDEDETQN